MWVLFFIIIILLYSYYNFTQEHFQLHEIPFCSDVVDHHVCEDNIELDVERIVSWNYNNNSFGRKCICLFLWITWTVLPRIGNWIFSDSGTTTNKVSETSSNTNFQLILLMTVTFAENGANYCIVIFIAWINSFSILYLLCTKYIGMAVGLYETMSSVHWSAS